MIEPWKYGPLDERAIVGMNHYKARCPQCNEWMEVERVDNGVMMVWHGVHCGWGQAYFADEDVHKDEAT